MSQEVFCKTCRGTGKSLQGKPCCACGGRGTVPCNDMLAEHPHVRTAVLTEEQVAALRFFEGFDHG